jgi:hypothetical protein
VEEAAEASVYLLETSEVLKEMLAGSERSSRYQQHIHIKER